MKKKYLSCLLIPIYLLLYSCAPFKFSDSRAGVCNELNSQIIFSGATNDPRTADIQTAQEPLLQKSYRKKCE